MNPTLNDVKDWGAEVRYISRSSYKKRNDPGFLRGVTEEFSNSMVIPEGGTNKLAVQGLAEMIEELDRPYDNIAVPVGTGGPLSGSSLAIHDQASVLGYVVLKGAEEIDKDIKKLTHKENYVLYHEYHFGGYAKHTQDLVEFINSFKDRHGISLDPVYTGKMMFGFYDQVSKGMYNSKKIILIHTGGLQGVRGFNERFGNILD